ncbi:MAG: serine hydrolase domain-containing protein [Pseudomonadota bacterium]
MLRIAKIILLFLTLNFVQLAAAQNADSSPLTHASLSDRIMELQKQRPDVEGFAIAVIDGDRSLSAASGVSAPDGTPMTAETPFRIASVTKPFVAAALLRLVEQGKLNLDASLAELISEEHSQLLRSDGYDLDGMTLRQVMMHSAGLADHFASEAGIAAVFANPFRVWTRTEQLALMVELTDPLGKPGEKHVYSDTGYILLGEILERITGMSLSDAVRDLNSFDAIGIEGMRWETLRGQEPEPARAHQWIDGFDIHAMNGSVDAFGGGGLVGNVIDTARYFDALFSGEVFDSAQTLSLMTAAPGHPERSTYRLGLDSASIANAKVYMHSGFWGVFAMHVPSHDYSVAIVSLSEAGWKDAHALAIDLAKERIARSVGGSNPDPLSEQHIS